LAKESQFHSQQAGAGKLMPSIEVDFNNCDREGTVRLNTIGAIQSLNDSQVTLRNGLEAELTSGDFFPTKGIVEYSDFEHLWVARFDVNDLRDKEFESPSER
jgi:hypothetical protein